MKKRLMLLQSFIIEARSLAYKNASYEQISDLLDAIHNFPEFIESEQDLDLYIKNSRCLQNYDKKWAKNAKPTLIEIYNKSKVG